MNNACMIEYIYTSMAKPALGHRGEALEPDFFRGVLGELVLFVFIGVGAAMTAGTRDALAS